MAFDESLTTCGIRAAANKNAGPDTNLDMKVDDKTVTIGNVVIPRSLDHNAPAKIPSEYQRPISILCEHSQLEVPV